MSSNRFRDPSRQRGVALAAGMMILLIITVIGVFSMRSSIFELRMAHNEETRIDAFERAQSMIDSIIIYDDNFPAVGLLDSVCLDASDGSCTMEIDDELIQGADADRSTATSTWTDCAENLDILSSSEGLAFMFDVEVIYDGTPDRLGRSDQVQGVLDVPTSSLGGGVAGQEIMIESVAAGAGTGACPTVSSGGSTS